MLESLEIKNYVLISELKIDFSSGFVTITGETGAGKSIILGALGLILGEKAKGDAVRQGEKEAIITAVFSFEKKSPAARFLEDREIEADDCSVVIQRVVKASGRSLISVNGYSIRGEELEELGSLLVDVSSQHAHQSLLKADSQREVLDAFSSSAKEYSAYKTAYDDYIEKTQRLDNLEKESLESEKELDYILFVLDELDKAKLKEREDEELAEELSKMSSYEAITENIQGVQGYLKGDVGEGVISSLARAISLLRKISDKDASLASYADRLEEAMIESEDISESLRDYLSSFSFSAEELDEKSARLSLLQRLKKKYGPTLSAVIEKREEYRLKAEKASSFDDLIADARKEAEKASENLEKAANTLHEKRVKGASALEKAILKNLRKLGMENALFKIDVQRKGCFSHGADDVVFSIAANKGEKMGHLKDVASGGELSRIMLSLKGALASSDSVDTLIFDEVDAGIGGSVANSVAEELSLLSESHQVIAITHLAQIAIKADEHLLVSKRVKGDRTFSSIDKIEGDALTKEIARLLSGETSDIALEHAKALLEVGSVV